MTRDTIKDQDFDALLITIAIHKGDLPKNVWANAQALIAFTILDEVWHDADCCFVDYGDEQFAAMSALWNSILGETEARRLQSLLD